MRGLSTVLYLSSSACIIAPSPTHAPLDLFGNELALGMHCSPYVKPSRFPLTTLLPWGGVYPYLYRRPQAL